MTAEISRYVLVGLDDMEGDVEYPTMEEAKIEALRLSGAGQGQYAIVAHMYEYADTELIWTPDGESVWPPSVREG